VYISDCVGRVGDLSVECVTLVYPNVIPLRDCLYHTLESGYGPVSDVFHRV